MYVRCRESVVSDCGFFLPKNEAVNTIQHAHNHAHNHVQLWSGVDPL